MSKTLSSFLYIFASSINHNFVGSRKSRLYFQQHSRSWNIGSCQIVASQSLGLTDANETGPLVGLAFYKSSEGGKLSYGPQ